LDLAYGLPALAGLVMLLLYVRRVATRARARRLDRSSRAPSRGVRSLSQRSEMRAGDDPLSVMDSMRLSARSTAPHSTKHAKTGPRRAKGGKQR
jgi:hypothetical protein